MNDHFLFFNLVHMLMTNKIINVVVLVLGYFCVMGQWDCGYFRLIDNLNLWLWFKGVGFGSCFNPISLSHAHTQTFV